MAIPQYLIDDILGSLFKKPEKLSFEDFKEEYQTGYVYEKPWQSPEEQDTRYYYDFTGGYDPFKDDKKWWDPDTKKRTKQKGWVGQIIGTPQGYEFSSPEEAYNQYITSIEDMPDTPSIGSIFDSGSILEGMAATRGLDADDLGDPEGFRPFTTDMFKKLESGTYTQDVEQGREPLLDTLIKRNQLASATGSGIEGYGQRERAKVRAEEQYIAGVENIYTGIESQKSDALQDIMNVLQQYREV